ncbi:unnamed protein product [Ceutorhynchus assimilis]|uniref:J domain-containing protein n=1 Tax=Ceutorhynchus assimilis TaxID=467358 RepID=A0A9N9MAH4_9CUCU|nr:unnamed protein product [Ceutorhynchus assimilis]
MSEKGRRSSSNDAIEKIIGNMTSEMQNTDGQYRPLGFSSQQNIAEPINWGSQAASNTYMNYGLQYQEPHLHGEQLTNYIHQATMFDPVPVLLQKNIHLPDYNNYNLRSNSAPQTLYNFPQTAMHSDSLNQNQNTSHTQIFDNLVGNWAVPNNSGTYSPFGNTSTFKPSLFDFKNQNGEHMYDEEPKFKQSELVDDKFNFNKDLRKSRPLAEVKPMRPSYSDVLTKPVPPTNNMKPVKVEAKDVKFKKDTRKNGKLDKACKTTNVLNRSNTNNDMKDLPAEKTTSNLKTEKKSIKVHQLHRRWASLDNITDSEPNSMKTEEQKRIKKQDDTKLNKAKNKFSKNINNLADNVSDNIVRAESIAITKNMLKKNKGNARQKQGEREGSERPSKRNQRARKKDNQPTFGIIGEKVKFYIQEWWKVFTVFTLWLIHLISDVLSLSAQLGKDFLTNSWAHLIAFWTSFTSTSEAVLKRWKLSAWIWEIFENRFKQKNKKPKIEEDTNNFLHNGLNNNITMPTTGDEAMKRLLACKGKDPYSILGVTPKCTDDDIKKYYKKQAFLVHPDKNNQPGAEEAFKILVHAFDMIGTSERRATYDRGVAESAFVVQNFSQMAELLQKLQQKMEMNANTIRCSACGDRHKRIKVDRPSYAARNCKSCKIHHAAREGDIWAEARCFGILWHYYACMEGSVYDITEWAGCQKETLKHLKPDSHHVQYRIALGKQNNTQPRRNSQASRMERPDLENLLNSLYGHNDGSSPNSGSSSSRPSKRKNKNRK